MENRARGIRLIIAAMMIMTLLLTASLAAADADPVRVSSLSEPQSVISEQDVNITIKIYNSGQTDMTEEITLFNPSGISVEKFSGLKAENSVTYTGVWHVTQDEIAAGKIKYYIRYTVDTGNGPTETTRTVPVTIQTEAAAPQLTATYSISTTAAKEGQSVSLAYTLSNTGNVELRNIVIENEGVTKDEVTAVSLSVGEKITLEDTFTMGEKELVSKPQITYQAAGSDKKLTISDMAKKTITVAEDGLDVVLAATNAKNVYPGEDVTFTLELKNSGNTPYTDLSIQASEGTAVASGIELAPGASYETEFALSFTQSTAVSVSISGQDGSGNPVAVGSSEIEVTTTDLSRALLLDVYAQAQTDTIYAEPAVVRFAVVVKNIGETDATTLKVEQAGTTVATIPSLPAGESRTLVFDLETSIAGKFRFDVSGRDAAGDERVYSSDVLQVTYLEPTPAPTLAPTPTPVPPTPSPAPTATPEPTFGEMIAQKVNMQVLYIAAGVLGGLIVLILAASAVSSGKRKKRIAGAIDTIERSPDVRNHNGAARRKAPKKAKQEKKPDAPIVPAQELESEPVKPQEASATPARDALRRRRAQEAVTNDETLRVAPVDQRPDFVAQGKVDDSQTRIFAPDDAQMLKEEAEKTAEAEAMKRREEEAKAAASKAKKRSEIKPLKKKKSLFGKKKEDDLFTGESIEDEGEDDFFE